MEDVIIENKQAMEMTSIYNGILSGTMDTFASVISNNLNIVMKFLATVTIVLLRHECAAKGDALCRQPLWILDRPGICSGPVLNCGVYF